MSPGERPYIERYPRHGAVRLQLMGVSVRFEAANTLRIKGHSHSTAALPADLAQKMRASFLVAGPRWPASARPRRLRPAAVPSARGR
jgi:hypothetical protein